MGCLQTRQADCLLVEEELERDVLGTLTKLGMH
jgi:hypothetical protein